MAPPSKECLAWYKRYPPSSTSPATTYFGGLPLLHDDVPWPRTVDDANSHMFLAQFDLGTLPNFNASSMLPAVGMLYFFTISGNRAPFSELGKVVYDPRPDAGRRHREAPADVLPISGPLPPFECEWLDRNDAVSFPFYGVFPRYEVTATAVNLLPSAKWPLDSHAVVDRYVQFNAATATRAPSAARRCCSLR